MVFGVFGGDQDVVNTVECVRDVAEYFVHKALKVLPSIFFFKPNRVRGSRNNPNGVIMPVFFYIFFRDGNLMIAF